MDLIWSDDSESYEPFGGYRLYRSVFDIDDWTLLETIAPGTYAFTDSTVLRGYPYFYSLCAFDLDTGVESPRNNYKKTLDGTPVPVVPSWSSGADWKESVRVVPNPYRGSAAWETPYTGRLAFTCLPPMCDLRIYSLAGAGETDPHRDFSVRPVRSTGTSTNDSGREVIKATTCSRQTEEDHVTGTIALIR